MQLEDILGQNIMQLEDIFRPKYNAIRGHFLVKI